MSRWWICAAALLLSPLTALGQARLEFSLHSYSVGWLYPIMLVVAILGLIAGVVGIVLTVIQVMNNRPGAVGYLIFFACAVVAGILHFVFGGALNDRLSIVVGASIFDAMLLVAIAVFFVYLALYVRRRDETGRRCLVCGITLDASWTTCPVCNPARPNSTVPRSPSSAPQSPNPAQPPSSGVTDPGRMTVPGGVGSPYQYSSNQPGRRTVIVGKKEYPVYAILILKPRSGPPREFPLFEPRTQIGRDGSLCRIPVDDEEASAQHAAVVLKDNEFILHDLASTNGTYINPKGHDDEPIGQPCALKDGDVIGVGVAKLVFKRIW